MVAKVSLDFETASVANLPTVGHHVYAAHPSTRILCLGWAIEREPEQIWFPGTPFPQRLRRTIENGAEVHCWNAAFEHAIWKALGSHYGLPEVDDEQFHCTMARAAFWGLPLKLDQAAQAARLKVAKDAEGHRLMLQMCRPRAYREDGSPRWWHEEAPERLVRLGQYCKDDVKVERAVGISVPSLPETERRLWLLDQNMNRRGLHYDKQAAAALHKVTETEIRSLSRKLSQATGGYVTKPSQAARVLNYLRAGGLDLDNLKKDYLPTIVVRNDLTENEREVISLYRQGAKASIAKLKAMRNYTCDDGRIRGLIQYGGAMRTMRWAGRGPQIQNYPRPLKGLNSNEAIEAIIEGLDARTIEARFKFPPLTVISACLRGCYTPEPGRLFAVNDYSAIEARIVAWLARQDDLLEVFRSGEDVYVYTAKSIGSDNRQLGKVLVLACGYGMGWAKFIATAATYGLDLSEEQAREYVGAWREQNSRIRTLWYEYDKAARDIILSGSELPIHCGVVSFRMAKKGSKLAGHLLMRLPSGRPIIYRSPKIIELPDGNSQITYMGHNLARQWVRIKTWGGKFVENADQAIARDLLGGALLRLDEYDVPLCTTIHDEIIAEPDELDADDTLALMQREMGITPLWATDLPLGTSGAVMARYGK